MAEKKDSGAKQEKEFDPDKRFKYVGFEVHPGKIKDLFKSEAEKEELVKMVRTKRESGKAGREETSFDVPRVAGYEKVVLTITSLLLIASLFLPWFSGYHEIEVETTIAPAEEQAVLADSLADSLGMEMTDSTALAAVEDAGEMTAATPVEPPVEEPEAAAVETGEAAEHLDDGTVHAGKDDKGFSSISAARKRKEIRREHQEASAFGSLSMIGEVLSSGFVLKITGILFAIYMLFCLAGGIFTIYALYGLKGDADARILKLKKVMKMSWVPVGIWVFCMVISFFGASYSFDTSDVMKQIGSSYGIGTYLSVLGYGFYLSLACFIMNAVKGAEI